MSEMEDHHRTLSRHLWGVLDEIGLSPEAREEIVNAATTNEILMTLSSELHATGDNHKVTTYVAGSSHEATTTTGLQSDYDFIFNHEYPALVDDIQNAPRDGLCMLLMTDSSTDAGYSKLQYVKDGKPMVVNTATLLSDRFTSVDSDGRVMRNNTCPVIEDLPSNLIENIVNGPASTLIPVTGKPVDAVTAYRCASWPGVASEWLTRERRHHWPTEDQIQKMCALGCFVVGVGHPNSLEQTLEWRISFSLQERHLMMSLNETQYKTYVLMKVVKTDFITSELSESISSYHCKTVMFYAIESTAAEFWVPDNLVNCLLHCLEAMYKCAVDGVCPNYFIPEANLFDRRVHGELREHVVSLLNELLMENGKFLFRISCDNIGIHLSAASTSGVPQLLDANMLKDSCRRAGDSINTIVTAILHDNTSIEALQYRISQLVSTTRVAEHTESETREAIQYVLPHIHTSLASHLAAAMALGGSGSTTTGNMRTLMEKHGQLATSSGLTSCRLKLAAIYYMLEEYTAAEHRLSDAAAALRGPYIHLPGTLLKSAIRYCIIFQPTEMAVTPAALQYEMFTLPKKYPWSKVDEKVFLHYMQYLLYDKLGDVGQRHSARNDLIDVAIKEVSLLHRETAYNLLGWIYKQEGYVLLAAQCFMHSIHMKPEDNAAKWHIGDLYLRQAKASQPCPK